ncbi:MAG: viral coat protein [Circoviridae sp.]|nr:MAG: viral coat protein [Circoviridae sp.]
MDEKDIPALPRSGYRSRKRPSYKSDTSRLRYVSGKQKWFAKQYRATPYDDPSRVAMRNMIGNDYRSASSGGKMLRNAMQYYGPGDYRSTLSRFIPKGSFGYLGRKLGGMSGIPGLDAVGAYAGNKFANYVGFGDYNNDHGGVGSVNQIAGGHPPISVNASGDLTGDVIMTRTEFVGNVTVSTGAGQTITPFKITPYQINPGLAGTFPWLSQIASNFELYDWEGLMFMYRPTSGEFGASAVSNALGKVVMATKYGVTQFNPFTSTVEAQNYDYANSTKPSMSMVHGVETKNSQQVGGDMLVIRDDAVTNNANIVLYDLGRLYLMTEGIPLAANSTAIIGELWVTYKVRLSRAKLWASIGEAGSYSRVQWTRTPTQFVSAITGSRSSGDFVATVQNDNAETGTCIVTNSSPTFLYTTFMVQIWGVQTDAGSSAVYFRAPTVFPSYINCSLINGVTQSASYPDNWRGPNVAVLPSTIFSHSTTIWLRVTDPNLPFRFNFLTDKDGASPQPNGLYQILVTAVDDNLPNPL